MRIEEATSLLADMLLVLSYDIVPIREHRRVIYFPSISTAANDPFVLFEGFVGMMLLFCSCHMTPEASHYCLLHVGSGSHELDGMVLVLVHSRFYVTTTNNVSVSSTSFSFNSTHSVKSPIVRSLHDGFVVVTMS